MAGGLFFVITVEYNVFGKWRLPLDGLILSLLFGFVGIIGLFIGVVEGITNIVEAKHSDKIIWRWDDE